MNQVWIETVTKCFQNFQSWQSRAQTCCLNDWDHRQLYVLFFPHVFIPFMFILYTCSREKTPVLRFPKPYFCSFFRSSSEDSMYGCCSTCQSKSSSSSLSSWHGSLMLHAPLKSGRGGGKKKKKWNSGNKEKTLEELEWQNVNAWDSVTFEHTNLLHQRLCRPGTCGGQETGQHV